jgi:hypothetical protein
MKEPVMDQDATQPETIQPEMLPPAAREPAPTPAAAPTAVATPAPAPARRGANGSRVLNVVLGIALVLAVGGIGFATGRVTAPPTTLANGRPGGPVFNGTGGTNGQGRAGGGLFAAGGPTLEGTVESVTDTTMTIKTADGQTIQVALNGSTTYHAQTDATSNDVATGGKVLVRLDVGSFGGANGGGPNATAGTGGGPTARDVTVVP